MTFRVAVLTPFAFPSVRGNSVTVERIVRGLRTRGTDVRVWDVSAVLPATIETEVAAYRPALIHAFHAWRVGPLAVRIARRLDVPLVITLTGTDANHDLLDASRAPGVRAVLEEAAAVVAFHESVARGVLRQVPEVRSRITIVPQAADFEDAEPFDLNARWPLSPERVLFVFPAGIRPVKNPRLPIEPFERLVRRDQRVRLLYAGPVIDVDEGNALSRALAGRPWARHVGTVPHTQMASLLGAADVVLNSSLSEGGMANSVLEALALGRAVLASDIAGNRSLIDDGVTGFLFRGEDELEQRAERLARDPALRARLGSAGRERVLRDFPPSRELDGYVGVYRQLVAVPCR